jgi:hypothetical protein
MALRWLTFDNLGMVAVGGYKNVACGSWVRLSCAAALFAENRPEASPGMDHSLIYVLSRLCFFV